MPAAPLWRERPYDAASLASYGDSVPSLVAHLLAQRGIKASDVEAYFDPSLRRLASPESLPGISDAVCVILPFVRERRKIVVFGDYDADGVNATAILVTALARLGGVVEPFIPLRHGEGYGMTGASIARLLQEQPDVALVVTVDNGITSAVEVAELRARGIKVVVTDHHLPGDHVPEADALVDPRVASCPGCEDLCGAGVAFFLSNALVNAATAEGFYTGEKFGGPSLVMAGVATVADIVQLRGQNRILVSQALAYFRRCAPLGLRELLDHAARRAEALVARDFAFTLAPRINAAGRMSSALKAYELLMCSDREAARMLAVEVDGFNGARKGVEQRMDREARLQVPSFADLAAVVVNDTHPLVSEPWHPGVAGIVASRLLEDAHVPVALAVGNTGSVRAPEGYNVHAALTAVQETLVRFGGHAAAGGFTVKEGHFEAFRTAFVAACAQQRASAPDAAALVFDMWVEPRDLTLETYAQVSRLEPFGEGNPEPVFGLQNVAFAEIKPMGSEGRHLSLSFVNKMIPRAVWWGHGDRVESLRAHAAARFDILFTLTVSDFGVEGPHVELRIVAIRPTVSTPLAP